MDGLPAALCWRARVRWGVGGGDTQRETERQTGTARETDRQTDRDNETDRRTDGERERQTETGRPNGKTDVRSVIQQSYRDVKVQSHCCQLRALSVISNSRIRRNQNGKWYFGEGEEYECGSGKSLHVVKTSCATQSISKSSSLKRSVTASSKTV